MSDRLVYLISEDFRMESLFKKRDGFKIKRQLDQEFLESNGIIVFPGGLDVHPKLYNEAILPKTTVSKYADERDLNFWNKVKEYPNIAKIGVCRGAQFLNVMNGGALYQDVNNHTESHNMIDLLITGTSVFVTSTHHQMMIPNEEKGLVIGIASLATSFASASPREKPEYDTEVVYYPETNSLCFQPHPEYGDGDACRLYFFDLIDHLEM